jgi:hypothetical protein
MTEQIILNDVLQFICQWQEALFFAVSPDIEMMRLGRGEANGGNHDLR